MVREFKTDWGFINYSYIQNEKYPNGLLLFMGSYIHKNHRGKGRFQEMVKMLFCKFPEGTEVQVPISNSVLISMFEKMGFKKTGPIEHWGELKNAVNLKGYI